MLLFILAWGHVCGEMNGQYFMSSADGTHIPFPGHRGKHIDLYSYNISTRYSEVYWTMQPEISLPEDFVQEFKGKLVVITGYEVDSVRSHPDGTEESVPITHQYDHHHNAYLMGESARLVDVGPAGSYRVPMHGGVRSQYELRDVCTDPDQQLPTAAFIVDGNGGEYRKSAHHTGKGFGILVFSPNVFRLQPMMINTKNPDGGVKPGGPIPTIRKKGWAPKNAEYSPLLECPCTDRKKKVIANFKTTETGLCKTLVDSEDTCFEAVKTLGLNPIVKNETSTSGPKGCSVVITQQGYEANFNSEDSKLTCGPDPAQPVRSLGSASELGISVSVDLDEAENLASITMDGPSDVWFGFGFGSAQMKGTYAIICDGRGRVSERTLGDHDPGTENPVSIRIISNTVKGNNRTVVIQRPLKTSSSSFEFNARAGALAFLSAVGSGPEFSIHKSRAASTLLLVETHGPLCVCADGTGGTIDGFPFNNHCAPQPTSDLLALKNDICFIETYEGGLQCCRHKSILLDADQEIPSAVDTFRMKFRLYYEPFDYQRHAFFMFWTNEQGAGEYDVPVTDSGIYTTTSVFTPRQSMRKCSSLADPWCAPNWNETGIILLIRAGTHCHAPACIGADLYLCPDGDSKCNETTGKLLCSNRPIYGNGKEERFSEPGYVAIPPCFWGYEEGLDPPPRLNLDTKLFSIKRNNATNYHYGVMGQWQMRGAWE